MLGVHFKPGGAFPFLGVRASDLTDTHVDLADVWGRSALELREELCTAKTPVQRFKVMERVLTARLERAPPLHPAISVALQMFGLSGASTAVDDAICDNVSLMRV